MNVVDSGQRRLCGWCRVELAATSSRTSDDVSLEYSDDVSLLEVSD